MKMKFIDKALESKGISTSYRIAELIGGKCKSNLVDFWRGKTNRKPPTGFRFWYLCRLRKISGLSWNSFGKLMDDEILGSTDETSNSNSSASSRK